MKKKILFVAYSIDGGGAEKTLRQVLLALDRAEFEPELCVFSAGGAAPSGVPLHVLSTALRPASVFLVFKLWRLLRAVRPDKVFSFLWGPNLVAILACLAAGVPAIVNEASVPSESVKRYPFPALRKVLISLLYRRSETVVAVSRGGREDLVANFGVPAGKVLTVHNGIPVAEVRAAAAGDSPVKEPYIFSCGSLVPVKNHRLLVEAAAGLPGALVVIAGRGPLKEELAAQAEKAGLRLLLPGYAENPYPYFRGASVFVLTSLYEGFGNVLLEAMACGVPVIAADCPGGVREIIEDGRTGLIVPQGSPEALRAAIQKLAGDRELARRLTANAAAAVEEKFDFGKMLAAYEGLLRGRPA